MACDPVGIAEIASRLGVQRTTVHKWLQRSGLPEADYPAVGGRRAWEWATILRWAGEMGHIRSPQAMAEYAELFGVAARPARAGGILPAPR